jgi:hypothetical protein
VANRPSGLIQEDFMLELTLDGDSGEIRYTLDGSEPLEDSSLYTGPIPVTTISATQVKARSFAPDLLPSPTVTLVYTALDASLFDFNSNLPLVIVETFGAEIPDEPKIPGSIHIIDVNADTGRSQIFDPAQHSGAMGIEVRGQSSKSRAKKSYGFELRDEFGDDLDVPLLGMPTESDWVLYGPYNFDRAMMRNPFIYEVSNQVGRYASRARYCEVFVNPDGGPIDLSTDYRGVYVFMERIKRDPNRVDIDRLSTGFDLEPEISGGYILKIDKIDPGDVVFSAAREQILHVYPKQRDIPTHQARWIERYMDNFGTSIYGANFLHPILGYRAFIDVESFIEFHLLRVLTKEPDNFVISTYFYKPRLGKIHMGPIWDFDRSMGADDDPRSLNPIGWAGNDRHGWWGRLFLDFEFEQQYNARWQELRVSVLSTENLHAIIDSFADTIAEAQERNYTRWTRLVDPVDGWESEVQQLKTWIQRRVEWMDSELVALPEFSSPEGFYEEPLALTLINPNPRGSLYYTANGPDPRTADDELDPDAILYAGETLLLDSNTRLRMRLRTGPVWSSLVEANYSFEITTIALTELMYQPAGGNNFEFVELYNYGDEPVRLHDLEFNRGIFKELSGELEFLAPGEYAVVPNDLETFGVRYDVSEILIADEYDATLSNNTERVILAGPVGEPIVDFVYQSDWHTLTAGNGHSLVLIDPNTPAEDYGDAASWRPSLEPNGSPGREDAPPRPPGQIAGDSNQDGSFNISDALHLALVLFHGAGTLPCGTGQAIETSNIVVLDTNADFQVNVADITYNLLYLFVDGPPPVQGTECRAVPNCPDVCALP